MLFGNPYLRTISVHFVKVDFSEKYVEPFVIALLIINPIFPFGFLDTNFKFHGFNGFDNKSRQ